MQHRSIVAAAIAAATASPLYAQTSVLAPVVVSATRFAETDPRVPASMSVITTDDIRQTPALTVADILKSQTGIELRPLYGPLAIDATIDLRGFGDTAGSNTLVLIDGQRLNPADLGGIPWGAVPLSGISRIEVLRGSGSILFGDRASGGVINIITDKSGKPRASASASLGDFGYRGADASAAGGDGSAYFNLFGHYAETHGSRPNTQQDEKSGGGRVGYASSFGDVFLDYGGFKNSNGLPGALNQAQYDANPRQSTNLVNMQDRTGWRLRPGVAADLAPNLTLEAEVGASGEDQRFLSPTFTSDRKRDTLSLTPRLRWRHGLGALKSETVAGVDFYHGDIHYDSNSAFGGPNTQTARQKSLALYAQNITDLTPAAHLTLGLRQQRMDQEVTDRAAALTGDTQRTRTAYEAGLSYDVSSGARVYGKVGETFRFAATDELFGFDPLTFATIFRGDLRPQHGPLREVGAQWHGGPFSLQASVYQLNLKDEIGYDSVTGSNVNFPATRRRGTELEGQWDISHALQARLGYAYTEARFTEGVYSGNAVPMVPNHKANLGLRWNAGRAGAYSAVVSYVGDRRYSGDFTNSRGKLSGYTTLDLQAEWNLKPWAVTARVMNALDKKYAPFAGISFAGTLFYYPADPRTFVVTARYDFR